MLSLSEDGQSDVVEASILLLGVWMILNIDNNFFDGMVGRICPSGFGCLRPTCQIPGPHFCICLYGMVLSRLKSMINEMILVLILCVSGL